MSKISLSSLSIGFRCPVTCVFFSEPVFPWYPSRHRQSKASDGDGGGAGVGMVVDVERRGGGGRGGGVPAAPPHARGGAGGGRALVPPAPEAHFAFFWAASRLADTLEAHFRATGHARAAVPFSPGLRVRQKKNQKKKCLSLSRVGPYLAQCKWGDGTRPPKF